MEFMRQMVYWHWWIAAMVFVILEVFVPGAILIWFGISAGVVGILLLLFPSMAWEIQIVLFTVLAVASILIWRVYAKRHPEQSDYPTLNRRGEQYVDRVFTLEQAITDGVGKVRVDDSTWKVQGPDVPAGTRIRVTDVNGTVLVVEAVETQ